VERKAAVSGRDLKGARRGADQYNQPNVEFSLNAAGSKKFAKVTGDNIGRYLGIVLDNQVMSAPVIKDRISTPNAVIEGGFDVKRAEDLALVLRSGSLPASVQYLEERTVGPSLGRDSIRQGVRSGLFGLLLITLFMLVYYKMAGVNAIAALALNVVLLLGVMAYFGAVMTLPGIAGVILTIGMAVDANVLVFERIREEILAGKSVKAAISLGFSRAMSAIVDSNLTTILSALFLFQFGTGPIKGFAVTLIIGLLASMFTAVFVSRFIFDVFFKYRERVETLSI
jgi:preprotein translocase subunit SecD